MTAVALGLGSNKTFSNLRPQEILGGAVFELSKIFRGVEISSVYRTKAMYVSDQDDFYNMALVGFLDEGITARALLERTQAIEAAFGRDREKEIRFGPRSLDIDIELFGEKEILESDLQIPHPRLKERAFVLVPLLEVMDKLDKAQFVNQGASLSLNESQIVSSNAIAHSANAQTARAVGSIISTNATTRSVDAKASREAVSIISSNATACNADNINGKIFCFSRDELSAALSSLGESGVEEIIRAQDFLPLIKSRLQNGTSSG